jgi:thiamine pyrophosphokinase
VVDPPPTLEPDLGNASGGTVEPEFVVVLGGSLPHPGVVAHLADDRFVIAADSGLDQASTLGLTVDLVVGDLDSVTPEALAVATAAGIPVERHPSAKDAIDAELAIDAALARGARRLVVVSGGVDRLDHVLAGHLLLAHPRLAAVDVQAWAGPAWIRALQGPSRTPIAGPDGAYVSLVPVHGRADGITTSGLRYPLHGEPLDPGSSRGISNELLGGPACVAVERGALLVIVPHALGGQS